ncbi:MAG: NADH-quinone oxidoreductase subunit NuoN [Hyphomicrobiales bacterium]|nr:NADH-quinone oxidoreductase subunit NuoN [Hyphomicrobiales bacterium]
MPADITADIAALATGFALTPEIFLALAAMALLLGGVFAEKTSAPAVTALSIAALIAAGALVTLAEPGVRTAFGGAVIDDAFARMMKLLTLAASAFSLLLSVDYLKRENIFKFEFPVLVLLSTVGMMLMISANDLITLYMGFELQSLALYVIAAFHRDNVRSSEAGLKYFVLGALSSGMLLYGCSLVYGAAGSTSFPAIAAAASGDPLPIGLVFGLVFVVAGMAFKVSAVPFHMWTPDVYEGAPAPVTAFFSAAPKVAAMALFTRVVIDAFPNAADEWRQIVIAVAVGSMALGAFAAIGQRNIKRLMAYSSIGNVGFALIGLAVGTAEGVRGLIVYMAIYLAMTLGAFACVIAMRRDGRALESTEDLAGLSRSQPATAFIMAMLMVSLAGIPPLAGFFAKLYVFQAAIDAKMFWLAVFGVVMSVVAAYYYLRIAAIMYFYEPAPNLDPMARSIRFVFVLAGAFVLLFVAAPAPLIDSADYAARSLFPAP